MLSFCDTGHFGGLGDDVEAAAMTGDDRRWPTRLGTKTFYVLALEKKEMRPTIVLGRRPVMDGRRRKLLMFKLLRPKF